MYAMPRWKTPWRRHVVVACSNSNDGCFEAYLCFNIGYLHKKNTTLNGNKISFNLAYYLKFTMHKSDYLPFKSSKLNSFKGN